MESDEPGVDDRALGLSSALDIASLGRRRPPWFQLVQEYGHRGNRWSVGWPMARNHRCRGLFQARHISRCNMRGSKRRPR